MGGNQIGRDCQISDDVCLHPNVVIYANSQIGHRVTIHAGTVIGSDGYGYVFDEGRHRKMLQVGNVIIHDDVEIGANAAIDRGALGSTVIGQGTKIDNLVHTRTTLPLGGTASSWDKSASPAARNWEIIAWWPRSRELRDI